MDSFTRRSLESLTEQFTSGAEKFPELRHVAMLGGSAHLGIGAEIASLANCKRDTDPQMFALKFIGEGLATRGMVVGKVLSHDSVILQSNERGAFGGSWSFARSVIYGHVEDRAVSGYFRYRQLSRDAYQLVRKVNHREGFAWNRLAGVAGRESTEPHYWSVGLALWAECAALPFVPVERGQVSFHGGPQFIARVDGTSEPFMTQRLGEAPQQLVMPFEVFFGAGLRRVKLPSKVDSLNLIYEMCKDCQTIAIRHDVFSASATAIRWTLGQESEQVPRLYIDDIDSFAKVRGISAADVADVLDDGCLTIPEDAVKSALEQILGIPFHRNDSPAELCDIYTSNTIVGGARRTTAMMLKGPGIRAKELEIKHCGSKGNQLLKLFDSPADLFVVQFTGRISESVIKDVHGKNCELRARGAQANYLVIDGQDTARLLYAYGLLPNRSRGTP